MGVKMNIDIEWIIIRQKNKKYEIWSLMSNSSIVKNISKKLAIEFMAQHAYDLTKRELTEILLSITKKVLQGEMPD